MERKDAPREESVVVVVVEADPRAWRASEGNGGLQVRAFLQHLVVYLRALWLLHVDNRVAVFASVGRNSHFLGEMPMERNVAEEQKESDVQVVLRRLHEAVQAAEDVRPSSGFASAFARALCYVRKARSQGAFQTPRIFFLRLSADENAQYVSTMNCVFCAQKQKVVVDACMLGQDDSPFLQQAAYLTGGIYQRLSEPEGLLQYLMMAFVTDVESRTHLRMPKQRAVDFRASCFCHRRPIDVGHVCSVCLSIFCESVATCTTCGAAFLEF